MSTELRERFQTNLNNAIARRRSPGDGSGLHPSVRAAISAVATAHPDAGADLIAMACDVFDREHGKPQQQPDNKPALTTVRSYCRSRR